MYISAAQSQPAGEPVLPEQGGWSSSPPALPQPALRSPAVSQVCSERFDEVAATVVCRQLGLPTPGRALGTGYFKSGTGRVWLTGVACSGDEDKLSDCPHNTWGAQVATCTHGKVSSRAGAWPTCDLGVGKCGHVEGGYPFCANAPVGYSRASSLSCVPFAPRQDVGIACGLEARLPACSGTGSACSGEWSAACSLYLSLRSSAVIGGCKSGWAAHSSAVSEVVSPHTASILALQVPLLAVRRAHLAWHRGCRWLCSLRSVMVVGVAAAVRLRLL